jgi:hypothetical protein
MATNIHTLASLAHVSTDTDIKVEIQSAAPRVETGPVLYFQMVKVNYFSKNISK